MGKKSRKRVKRDRMELSGIVVQAHRGGTFEVEVQTGQVSSIILASVCGSMRKNNIKVLLGDDVKVEVSPYDTSRGRIIRRGK